MTANDPSLLKEAVNHSDTELPGESNRWNRRLRRLRPEEARASAQT